MVKHQNRSIASNEMHQTLPKTYEEWWNWQPTDGFKYEWMNGKLIKQTAMDQDELLILRNLTRLFHTTKAYQLGGELVGEVKTPTEKGRGRIPDISFYSHTQLDEIEKGNWQVPLFAIEILSPTNTSNEMEIKLNEYFKHGVRVVWHIYPDLEKVYVYTSPVDAKICIGTAVCSAENVIEGFRITVKDIFKKRSLTKV